MSWVVLDDLVPQIEIVIQRASRVYELRSCLSFLEVDRQLLPLLYKPHISPYDYSGHRRGENVVSRIAVQHDQSGIEKLGSALGIWLGFSLEPVHWL